MWVGNFRFDFYGMISMNQTTNQTLKGDFTIIYTIIWATIMSSLAILTIIGNTIVIYALRTNRHLRTVMCYGYCFVFSCSSIPCKPNLHTNVVLCHFNLTSLISLKSLLSST
ncbi:unnamed protein product [Adineta ricciae]|uniref:Uncharacterized protein n=1 Tax=Adineta ricciae TaxID=249248 RepID=A0A815PLP7_ADIRI|nr:unnamed protein product [Adineta ricciae]